MWSGCAKKPQKKAAWGVDEAVVCSSWVCSWNCEHPSCCWGLLWCLWHMPGAAGRGVQWVVGASLAVYLAFLHSVGLTCQFTISKSQDLDGWECVKWKSPGGGRGISCAILESGLCVLGYQQCIAGIWKRHLWSMEYFITHHMPRMLQDRLLYLTLGVLVLAHI